MFRDLAEEANIANTYAWRPQDIEDFGSERQAIGTQNHALAIAATHVASNQLSISPTEVVSRHRLILDGIVVEVIQSFADRLELAFCGSCDVLLAYQERVRDRGHALVAEVGMSARGGLTETLNFVPAGREFREALKLRKPYRVICLYLDPKPQNRNDNRNRWLQARISVRDKALWNDVVELASLIEDGPKDLRYCEALSIVTVRELHRNLGERIAPIGGGLAIWQQRLVSTYIEEHLAEKISISRLASLVRVSKGHFCRAFRQSFGSPPHRYHLERRIEHAMTLLQHRGRSVTEIGLALGFSDTSAFSASFRQTTGRTPSQYRRGAGIHETGSGIG